jgi:hypothetical protein
MYFYLQNIKSNTYTDKQKADSAYLLVSMAQGFNFLTIWGIANHYLKFTFTHTQTIIAGTLMAFIFGIINHFYLFRHRQEIFETCERQTQEQRNKGKMRFWLYLILTYFLLFCLGSIFRTPPK